jgi:isopenicillin-N N-acyltransferase-like protein
MIPAATGDDREFGATWRAAIERTFDGYVELFAAYGVRLEQVRDWGAMALAETRAWAPALADEIEDVAAGAGLQPWQLGALNGRTEILAAASVAGEGECSTSVVLDKTPRTVQTWDWLGMVRYAMVVRTYQRVCTFTEFGVVGKIGVNSAGLGVHFNVLRHLSDHAEIGVPVHVVARRILDEASTVDEAAELARSARLSASSVLTVVTAGQARCLELSPAGVAELPADGFLVHTNHFLDAGLAVGERMVPEESTTFARLAELRERIGELGAADRTARAEALRGVCAHADPALPPHQRWESLATISLDVADRRMYVHHGGPCTVRPDTWQSFSAKGKS